MRRKEDEKRQRLLLIEARIREVEAEGGRPHPFFIGCGTACDRADLVGVERALLSAAAACANGAAPAGDPAPGGAAAPAGAASVRGRHERRSRLGARRIHGWRTRLAQRGSCGDNSRRGSGAGVARAPPGPRRSSFLWRVWIGAGRYAFGVWPDDSCAGTGASSRHGQRDVPRVTTVRNTLFTDIV